MSQPSEQLARVLQTEAEWYKDPDFLELYNRLFKEGDGSEAATHTEEKWQVIRWFASLLAQNLVRLNNTVKQGYNDDDRKGKYEGATAYAVDSIVVHHTTTADSLTIWELEVVSLLRLYLPHFMDGMKASFIKFLIQTHPQLQDQPLAPASGHFMIRRNEEGVEERVHTFVGYHYLIYPDGTVLQLLDLDYMGFHAGNYRVNARSIGIALVGDFSHTEPTPAAQAALKELVTTLNQQRGIQYMDGHSKVRKKIVGADGKEQESTICPGGWFEAFATQPGLPVQWGIPT
jgi:hypothetical protein